VAEYLRTGPLGRIALEFSDIFVLMKVEGFPHLILFRPDFVLPKHSHLSLGS
jgi:hypothetical protein